MSPHEIERRGKTELIKKLRENGKEVEELNGTFDLKVDGIFSEVKTKGRPSSKFDFISLTENQYKQLKKGTTFKIFLVCNVKHSGEEEFFEIESKDLRNIKPHHYTTSEFSKRAIKNITKPLKTL